MEIESCMGTSSFGGLRAQLLVRLHWPECATAYEPPPEEREFYRQVGGHGMVFQRGTGCAFCAHTGFYGRIGVFEVLRMSDAIKRLLIRDAPPEALRQRATTEGMTTLRSAGLSKIDEGLTT